MLELLFIIGAYLVGFHMGEVHGEQNVKDQAHMMAQIEYAHKLEHLYQLLSIDTRANESLASQVDNLEFDK